MNFSITSNLVIQTLGRSEVLIDSVPAQWHAEAARELFFYLLSHVEGCSKEEILEQLWGLEPDLSSNNRFRVTVHRVRTALARPDALQEEYGRYRLSNEVLMATDVHQLYLTLERCVPQELRPSSIVQTKKPTSIKLDITHQKHQA
jgi:two-component SAPR family response regulator